MTCARLLADLTWPEAAELAAAGAVLVVPVGSTEQHGPHLPLSTDTDIAVALCQRLANQRPADGRLVVIAPTVPYGSSGEHAGFAGTISIGQEATELLLVELCRSACETFGSVLLVSAHGGNAGPVGRAVSRLRDEGRDVGVFAPAWSGELHAGRAETSMQLSIDAGRVHLGRAEPGDTRPLAEIADALRAGGVAAVSGNGVLGDPVGSTAAEGLALLDGLAAELIARVDACSRVRA